jgi:galactokinase
MYVSRMDQTASVFGVKNSALAIHFYPKLEVESVPFPKAPNADLDPVFVISHSLVVSDKHVTAPVCYNLRVVECRFASLMLAKTHLKTDDWKSVMTMREFQERYFAENASDKSIV